jgi:hypothetical protein
LQNCTQLRKLWLCDCAIRSDVLQSSAAALASLPNLKNLTLQGSTPITILAQLTGLTKLSLHGSYYEDDDWAAAAMQNPQLQCFELSEADQDADRCAPIFLEPPHLQRLLTACPSITHLHLRIALIKQQGLDALLSHGTNISSLAVWGFNLTESRVSAACQWKQLSLSPYSSPTSIELYAYLPLRTVQEFSLSYGFSFSISNSSTSVASHLQLPMDRVPKHELPQLLLQATTNLAACPAWQAAKPSSLMLCTWPGTPGSGLFSQQERADLLRALAPLAGPHLTGLQFHVHDFTMEHAEVLMLERVLGTGLTNLELGVCDVKSSFWAALNGALPSLGHLTLTWGVTYQPSDIVALCSRRPASQPLTVEVDEGMLGPDERAYLQASLVAQGAAHVRIVRQLSTT